MVRFYYVILTGIPLILFYIAVMSIYAAHPEKYDEYSCYALAQKLIGLVKKRERIEICMDTIRKEMKVQEA